MPKNTQPIPAHIDPDRMNTFLNDYFNIPLPAGSISTILTAAFHALIGAKVIVLDDGTSPEDLQVDVHGGRVMLVKTDPQTGKSSTTWWTHDSGLPSFDSAIVALADLAVAVLGSPPYTGKLGWPHTIN
jgi:hypothetical protein